MVLGRPRGHSSSSFLAELIGFQGQEFEHVTGSVGKAKCPYHSPAEAFAQQRESAQWLIRARLRHDRRDKRVNHSEVKTLMTNL